MTKTRKKVTLPTAQVEEMLKSTDSAPMTQADWDSRRAEPVAAIEGDDAATPGQPVAVVSEAPIGDAADLVDALLLAHTALRAAYTADHRAIVAVEAQLRRLGAL